MNPSPQQALLPRVVSANCMETLAQSLADDLCPLADPFSARTIVTPNAGMARWTALTLAQKKGICANTRFVLPNTFVHELFAAIVPETVGQSGQAFEIEAMTLRIASALAGPSKDDSFAHLEGYLADDDGGRKLLALAGRLAALFDKYLLFRPIMMENWDQGKSSHWQAKLWRAANRGLTGHRPFLRRAFYNALEGPAPDSACLPPGVSIFGVSALPPFIFDVLMALGRKIPVTFYVWNPCREFWGDVVSDRQMEKILRDYPDFTPRELHFEESNALLASLGRAGADFLQARMQAEHIEKTAYMTPKADTLLGAIQRDIFLLESPAATKGQKQVLGPDDSSVSIHNCHSPLREMEVLFDCLLAALEADRNLTPEKILVTAPDMETYAPFVEAVFGATDENGPRIPYSLALRRTDRQSPYIQAFFAAVELCQGRFEAASVLDLLALSSVRSRFGLSEGDLETIGQWVAQTRICWGVDEAFKQERGLPPQRENTWRAGLDRLLLGYALGPDESMEFEGISPAAGIPSQQAELLGYLEDFSGHLWATAQAMSKNRPLAQWSEIFGSLAKGVLDEKVDEYGGAQALRDALAGLAQRQEQWGFDMAVCAAAAAKLVQEQVQKSVGGAGFMQHGVNFCSLLPAAGAPFDVICLVGANEGVFPGNDSTGSFDLTAIHPLPGDRSRANEDRYAFLQTISSAKKRLVITYTGQSQTDNQSILPSSVVCELIDYIDNNYSDKNGLPLRERIVTRHRLHAFAPQYFSGDYPGLFSYSPSLCRAAQAGTASTQAPAPFAREALAHVDFPARLPVWELEKFFANPSQAFCRTRLKLNLDLAQEAGPQSDEAFSIGGLEQYGLQMELLEKALAEKDPALCKDWAVRTGRLPHGMPGLMAFDQQAGLAEAFAKKVGPFVSSGLASLAVEVAINSTELTGEIYPAGPDGPLVFRPATLKAKDRLKAWIRHLAACANQPAGEGFCTRLIFADHHIVYSPVDQKKAKELLNDLLFLYREGLSRPLPFFPASSFAYAEARLSRGKDRDKALEGAEIAFYPQFKRPWGEGEDPYIKQCFGGIEPLDDRFADLAERVFEPCLEHTEKG
ncbi:MAG: exodeoxyribonuclease V subunit gamma [Desulfatibacillaceae bacterium]|nr:exodeoxyribonuclease V subunit gamma [Desulfatibacillaceae bacterium]